MSDNGSYIRRSGDEYGDQFAALFPSGPAWPRDEGSLFQKIIRSLSMIWGDVDSRAGDLLERESDPRTTVELLDDWERAFGLPDPCLSEALTVADRQVALVNRMTIEGAQSRSFFIGLAERIGYQISIHEYSPFMCGISRCGVDSWEIGSPEIRFYWRVLVSGARISWFRAGSGQSGVDPHVRTGIASDLECLLRRWKPAHTEIIFDYTGMASSGAMTGTP